MSGLYENNKTIRELNEIISKNHPGEDVQFYFVFGYPRSDIGKGTLIAQLLNCVPKSDAIKFDGLLNTNENGRHTASGHDDFGIYEQFNPGRKWSREHYLLGGELFRDFINKYGENENLQMSIHFSKYVESVIYKMWNNIGKPQTLFIEVGGLISDPEVGPIFTPIVQRMQKKNLCKVILITELQYGDYIKTKEIQEAYRLFLSKNINPWLIMMREPIELQCASTDERLEFERVVSTKIRSNFNEDFLNIISIPYFHNINEYTEYIKERVFNMFNNKDNKNNN